VGGGGAGGGDLASECVELLRGPGGAVDDAVAASRGPQVGVDAAGGGLVGPCGEGGVGDAGLVGEPAQVRGEFGVVAQPGHQAACRATSATLRPRDSRRCRIFRPSRGAVRLGGMTDTLGLSRTQVKALLELNVTRLERGLGSWKSALRKPKKKG